MYYCEKCRSLSNNEACFRCDCTGLREVRNEDFCFLVECEEIFGRMLEASFLNEGINCALVPVGSGVRTQLGLSLGGYGIYVPYQFYSKAQDMLTFFTNQKSPTDRLKETILKNIDKWVFETKSTEKKIRKKCKLGKDVDVLKYVKEKVEYADHIEDVGVMSCGEHGLLVKSGSVTLWFSSESYKISI